MQIIAFQGYLVKYTERVTRCAGCRVRRVYWYKIIAMAQRQLPCKRHDGGDAPRLVSAARHGMQSRADRRSVSGLQ